MGEAFEKRRKELEKDGWKEQFIACEPRLSEAAAMYREIGFEVHLEPMPKEPQCDNCAGGENAEEKTECRICYEGREDQYRIIFTRPAEPVKTGDSDLS